MFIPSSDNKTSTEVVNPEFLHWEKKDQCILSWFIATLIDKVVPIVYGCKTSGQVWAILATQYAFPSQSRINQLRRQLQTYDKAPKLVQISFT